MAVPSIASSSTGGVILPAPQQAPPVLLAAEAGARANKRIAAAAIAIVASGLVERRHGVRRSEAKRHAAPRRSRVRLQGFRDDAASFGVNQALKGPGTLYELLKVSPDASPDQIKKAYYNMQKICHPDVAGPEGAEMCIVLNDAYETLKDPKERKIYDERMGEQMVVQKANEEENPPIVKDLGPTWKWSPKKHKKEPKWAGVPKSRSVWNKVAPEGRGEHHIAQQFVYVDEWRCVTCRNCCDIAPKTFCIDIDNNRARVYSQWGNIEEYLEAAVESCPVSCISWVSREELQALEHVTAVEMFHNGSSLPCPMAWRQGLNEGNSFDPFDQAKKFIKGLEEAEAKYSKKARAKMDKMTLRIVDAVKRLPTKLRELAGW